MHRLGIVRAEHHQRGPPPAVHRILRHRLLLRTARRQRHQHFKALALVEALLLANPDHRPRIRAVGGALQRNLVDDRRAVHQPADYPHVGPGKRGIVEDRGVLGAPFVQSLDHLLAGDAQRFRCAVQVQAVPGLVLHLGQQNHLALERGRAGDPVALRLHADHLRVRVLGNLPDQVFAIRLRHPVLGLDLSLLVHPLLEGRFQFPIAQAVLGHSSLLSTSW